MKEEEVFFFNAKPGINFLSNYPTSHRHWKERFFFIQFPDPLPPSPQWQHELPTPPVLGFRKTDPEFVTADESLKGLKFDVTKLVSEEGLLYLGGLSPIAANLSRPFGKH